MADRRMFRLVDGSPGGPLYAALLDDWVRPVSFGDPEAGAPDTGPVQKLAAETAALALADAGLRDVAGMLRGGAGLPRGGAGMRRGDVGGRELWGDRAGLFIASSVAGVGAFVREQFGFAADVAQPDAAATSSLHAVAAAAAALRAGELDLAVAGGVELGLDPAWLAAQARAGTLGRGGMRVYAADPAGLLPGEGCGIVVLARSADVRAAGLPVYAEITGWNTVPVSPSLDAEALLVAYRQAGVDPADIQLIEGEGTGTAAGDLSELTAFAQLRRGGRSTAALGAASAGIGYTRAAAGIASLVKTAVAMAAGMIPPGTGCARQHPLIESGDALLRLPRLPEPWPDGNAGASGARLAAVNSLGTADPAAWPDLYGPRKAEGVHLVLGREAEDDGRRGRRRRPAETALAAPPVPPAAAPPVPPAAAPPVPPAAAPPVPSAAAPPVPSAAAPPVPSAVRAEPPTTPLPKIPAAPAARAEPQQGAAESPGVFALCGPDPGMVASTLEVIAGGAAALSPTDLRGLARELALGVPQGGYRGGPVRVALTAATPEQLAARARAAVWRLTAGATAAAGDPDVYVSTGAAGRVVVLFGGLAGPGLAQSAQLAASLAGLRTLDSLGVTPGTAVGYSLGEITGLVWAGCLPATEGARLVAQCGQVLRGCTYGPAAMARVAADAETARGLGTPDGLHLAAYEGARSHVLAGSTAGIRNLTRRAAVAGVTVEVLGITHALHSPAMASCAAPLRTVFAATRFAAPRRRLISTITGRQVLPADDLTELLASQLRRPVLFAQAMELAAGQADLIVIAGPDDSLAGLAAGYRTVPCVTVRGDPPHVGPATAARVVAALFAAGAIGSGVISDVEPGTGLGGPFGAWGTLAGRFVPRMREGEAAEAGTTIRSV